MMDKTKRGRQWARNPNLESMLEKLSQTLVHVPVEPGNTKPTPLFICGVGRSGSSLLMQYFAASRAYAYPSNLISRFYSAPHVGQMVQSLLLDSAFDHRDQLADLRKSLKEVSFESSLGHTQSALSPNEFWYFWRRFFAFEDGETYRDDDLFGANGQQFVSALAAWQNVASKPVVMKALTATWNILPLARLLPEARFIILRRDPIDTMLGLLNARQRFWGSIDSHYGIKMPVAIKVAANNPIEEVALQVAGLEVLAIEKTQQLDEKHRLVLSYNQFCENPHMLWEQAVLEKDRSRFEQVMMAQTKDFKSLSFKPRRVVADPASSTATIDRADLKSVYEQKLQELRDAI